MIRFHGKASKPMIDNNFPQQKNGYDCAVFVTIIVECIVCSETISFDIFKSTKVQQKIFFFSLHKNTILYPCIQSWEFGLQKAIEIVNNMKSCIPIMINYSVSSQGLIEMVDNNSVSLDVNNENENRLQIMASYSEQLTSSEEPFNEQLTEGTTNENNQPVQPQLIEKNITSLEVSTNKNELSTNKNEQSTNRNEQFTTENNLQFILYSELKKFV